MIVKSSLLNEKMNKLNDQREIISRFIIKLVGGKSMYHDTWMRHDRMNENERTLKLNEMSMPLLDDQFITNLQTKHAVANSAISFEFQKNEKMEQVFGRECGFIKDFEENGMELKRN